MNVLSLFDGMSCGQIALQQLGIKVDNYYASEIDKYCIQITQKNFPNTIQIGDVCDVKGADLPKIDLIMGGSPCQGFSFAGKQLAFDDPRSKLFFEFVRLVKECQPKYFLLENVRMKKEFLAIISEHLGVEPVCINSALVSAQNRVRYYWTNIPNVELPEDKGIVLKDILENDAEEPMYSNIYGGFGEKKPREHFNKSVTIRANSGGGAIPNIKLKDFDKNLSKMTTKDDKSFCLTSNYHGAIAENSIERKQRTMIPTSLTNDHKITLTKKQIEVDKPNQINPSKKANGVQPYMQDRVFHVDGKSHALTRKFASRTNVGDEQEVYWRKLTPVECERLQTVPDNYTEGVSNTQRYKMLGNGWTIEVITHILKNMELPK